jgi:hypothetical protein
MILIAKLVWNMTSTIADTETAFLHSNLDEEIYMEIPKGLTIGYDKN